MTVHLARFLADDSGADLIEYAILAAVVAMGCAVALTAFKDGITGFFSTLVGRIDLQ